LAEGVKRKWVFQQALMGNEKGIRGGRLLRVLGKIC